MNINGGINVDLIGSLNNQKSSGTGIKSLTNKVIISVIDERIRQDKKWGTQRHSWGEWLGILGEEFGEVCQAINRIHFPIDAKETDADDLYTELMHVAAVAVAIAEHLEEERDKNI
jgi:NTP pyrophosphatase (non-canonical NTP hydrolase)